MTVEKIVEIILELRYGEQVLRNFTLEEDHDMRDLFTSGAEEIRTRSKVYKRVEDVAFMHEEYGKCRRLKYKIVEQAQGN